MPIRNRKMKWRFTLVCFLYLFILARGFTQRERSIRRLVNIELLHVDINIALPVKIRMFAVRKKAVKQHPLPLQAKLSFGLRMCCCFCISALIISLSGDVEINPGPGSQGQVAFSSIANKNINLSSMKCGLLNTRSVCNKLNSFHQLVFSNDFDVFAVTETWLGPHIGDSEILTNLPYTCYRNDRHDGRKAGGVLLIIKNNFVSCRRLDLEAELEMVVVEIELKDAPNVLVAAFYKPPERSSNFVNEFSSFLHKVDILRTNKKLVILGDFNFPKINWPSPCFVHK